MGITWENSDLSRLTELVCRCNPFAKEMNVITWSAQGNAAASWKLWVTTLFEPILLPHFAQVLRFSISQAQREIVALDCDLNNRLPEEIRQSSIRSGKMLIQQKLPRGERLLMRIQNSLIDGVIPGHFATLFAVRAAAFSIPERTALLCYLCQELLAGGFSGSELSDGLQFSIQPVNDYLQKSPNSLDNMMHFHGGYVNRTEL